MGTYEGHGVDEPGEVFNLRLAVHLDLRLHGEALQVRRLLVQEVVLGVHCAPRRHQNLAPVALRFRVTLCLDDV